LNFQNLESPSKTRYYLKLCHLKFLMASSGALQMLAMNLISHYTPGVAMSFSFNPRLKHQEIETKEDS